MMSLGDLRSSKRLVLTLNLRNGRDRHHSSLGRAELRMAGHPYPSEATGEGAIAFAEEDK